MKTDFLLRNRFLPIHIVVFVTLYMVLGFLGFLHQVPGNQNLILWDSAWYNSVRLSGYWFDPAAQSNSGFFPLFPYFWRVLGVGVFQISLINAAIALFSFGLIANTFRFETDESLLYLSLPGMFFLYIPYTESLFYLFSAMMLIGLYKKNNLLIMVGIFLSSLVRPTSFFFLPAIIFMEIINAGLGQNAWKKAIWNMMIYSFVTLAAFFLVVLIQWYQTGVWFAYIKAQTMFWGHAIHWPKFPLVTWEGARLLWLDGTAFLFCLAPLPWCIWLLAKVFSKKNQGILCCSFPKHHIFSSGPCDDWHFHSFIQPVCRQGRHFPFKPEPVRLCNTVPCPDALALPAVASIQDLGYFAHHPGHRCCLAVFIPGGSSLP